MDLFLLDSTVTNQLQIQPLLLIISMMRKYPLMKMKSRSVIIPSLYGGKMTRNGIHLVNLRANLIFMSVIPDLHMPYKILLILLLLDGMTLVMIHPPQVLLIISLLTSPLLPLLMRMMTCPIFNTLLNNHLSLLLPRISPILFRKVVGNLPTLTPHFNHHSTFNQMTHMILWQLGVNMML
uniref:ORF IV n=1 Tax=Citrus yellow mosaic virus TaxID=174178 RepID=G8FL51_9VIRU|nr:ORF IV [Citrus yellow mosaic virus]